MKECTLVTGATGFIGQYLLRQLLARGDAVRVLARRPDALPEWIRRRVEVVAGDVRDRAPVERAVNGARLVLHLAAFARAWARDPAEFTTVNVDAVAWLLRCARVFGVERLVHVSTILTRPPYRPASVNGRSLLPTPYEATKREGEALVDAYATDGRHAVIVHPARVYGPGPLHDANGVTKAIALYLSGRLRVRLADDHVLNSYVHADDVAAGILQAAARGAKGAHYVLGGENASFSAVLALVDDLGRTHRRVLPLPPRLAVASAMALEWWGALGGTVPITPGWVRVLLEDRRADIAPAQTALGYAPRMLRPGLAQTLGWIRSDDRSWPA